MLPELFQAIKEVSILQVGHQSRVLTTLEQIVSMVALDSTGLGSDRHSSTASETSKVAPSVPLFDASAIASSTLTLGIKITMTSTKCDTLCACQCHMRYRIRTPKWLQSAVGTLFYNRTVTPTVAINPCNYLRCKRAHPSTSTQFVYYFPTWMMRTAIAWSWRKDLNGGSKWVIELPREISSYAKCWAAVKLGNVNLVRDLLSQRQMSPYDVDSHGWTVLHVSSIILYSNSRYSRASIILANST
jgi:hypothetical protein